MRIFFVWLMVGVLGASSGMAGGETDEPTFLEKFGAYSLVFHLAQCALGDPPVTSDDLQRAWEDGEGWLEDLLSAECVQSRLPMPPSEPHLKPQKKRDAYKQINPNKFCANRHGKNRHKNKSEWGAKHGFYGAPNRRR